MLRVRTVFLGQAGMPAYCNLYFSGTGDASAEDAVASVFNFWTALATSQLPAVTANVQGTVEEINPTTGALLEIHDAATQVVTGVGAGEALPPANQLLVRLRTSSLRNNRLVQGRFNIPGRTETTSDNGNVSQSVQSGVSAAALTMSQPGTDNRLVVWSRPVNDAGGQMSQVTAVSCWERFAVLTSRRD